MKRKIGFYFDSIKLGDFDFESFRKGEIGMGGTDSQLFSLIYALQDFYQVFLFTNWKSQGYKDIIVAGSANLAEAAVLSKKMDVELLIFTSKEDEQTRKGINQLNLLKQPFILWDTLGPGPDFEEILATSPSLKRIVCVSKTQANSHRHRRYFKKITFIYNGKDYPTYPAKSNMHAGDNIHLGYIGAVSESKGFHWVARAWPAIKTAFPNAQLCVIGSIKTHDITKIAGDLGIGDPSFENEFIKPFFGNNFDEIEKNGVHFTGNISPNKMEIYLKDIDIGIVNPNIGHSCETFCISAIDFQSHHIPVVGANDGGLKETIAHGKTGILINDSNQLAKTIISLARNENRLAELSSHCAAWVKDNFSQARVNAGWVNLIEDVMNNRKNSLVKFGIKDINIRLIAKEMVRLSRSVKELGHVHI